MLVHSEKFLGHPTGTQQLALCYDIQCSSIFKVNILDKQVLYILQGNVYYWQLLFLYREQNLWILELNVKVI